MNVIWRKEWIRPYESAWSIFEKFVYANVTDRNTVLRTLGNKEIQDIKGTQIGNHHRELLTLQGLDPIFTEKIMSTNLHQLMHENVQKLMNPFVGMAKPEFLFSRNLRWCTKCLLNGYHSIFHQCVFINICPFHNITLVEACPKCSNQIPYLLSDLALSEAFTCKCGHCLSNLLLRWSNWPETQVMSDPLLKTWIQSTEKSKWLIIPKYTSFQLLNEKTEIILESSTFVHKSQETCEKSKEDLLIDISNNTRQIFKSIDKYILKKLLYKHIPCIKRLQYLLKKDNENFPEICPYAYAYIFWRQALLGADHFYGIRNTLKRCKENKNELNSISPLYQDELNLLCMQLISMSPNLDRQKCQVIKWIILKAASHLYYSFFVNWLEIAEEGAKQGIVPKGKDYRKLIHEGIQFAFQFPEKSFDLIEIRFLKVIKIPIKIVMNDHCRLVNKENKYMRSSTPIAVSMMTIDKKDLQVYVEEYVGKLKL